MRRNEYTFRRCTKVEISTLVHKTSKAPFVSLFDKVKRTIKSIKLYSTRNSLSISIRGKVEITKPLVSFVKNNNSSVFISWKKIERGEFYKQTYNALCNSLGKNRADVIVDMYQNKLATQGLYWRDIQCIKDSALFKSIEK